MNALIFIVVLGIVAGIVALVTFWSGHRKTDLGVVSHQWIAEHRFGSAHDGRR